jgi:hypothetical protein
MNRYRLLIPTIALSAVLAACTGGSGVLGTVPPAPTSSAPAVDQGSPDVPAASPSATPSASTSAEPSPTGTTIVRAYFLLAGPAGSAGLLPVLREIPATKATATAAMTAVLAGPNDAEQKASISTTIPAGTQLLDLTVKSGVATVDLSREFESGGGSASVLGRLAQVVYTLTQFPTIKSVVFEVEGQPVTTFSGQGVVLNGPVGRADYQDLLPAIFVDRPAWGAALGNPGRVTGNANVFEATFKIQLLDAGGHVLVDQQVMATCGTGCRGTFDTTLHYTVAKGQYGTLRVLDLSAKDGSPENVRDYSVWLIPAS